MELKRCMKLSAVVAVLLCGLTVVAHAESFATRHLYDAVAKGQVTVVGHVPSEQVMQLDVMFGVNDKPGLDAFVANLYNPKSSTYRHYMTPKQFEAQYGPTQQNFDATVRYLTTHGLTVMPGVNGHMHIVVTGPVSAVESAFHVQMQTYQHPTEDRTFYSPDREPTTDLPFALWHVSGLDNFEIPKPQLVQNGLKTGSVKKGTSTGSGPEYSFLGSDMRAAYCNDCWETGEGQDMALLEFEGTDLQDVATYYKNVHQTNTVPLTVYSADGTVLACIYTRYDHYCDDTEQTIDVTQALGMAPGLNSLTIYVGSSWSAILGAMADPPDGINIPYTISASWLGGGGSDPTTLDPIFEEFAADGQSFFVAAGDCSYWGYCAGYPAAPADDLWVTAVGGTDLSTNGPGGTWAAESAWADGGGGVSPDGNLIPYWQQYFDTINEINDGSTVYRNGPDVSANANFTYYVCADLSPCSMNEYGGTSFAAPLWAAFIALQNEDNGVGEGGIPMGFINPEIYYDSAYGYYYDEPYDYTDNFHDIVTGSQYAGYSAVGGYDLATGWGSPIGQNFIYYYYTGCDDGKKPGAKSEDCCSGKPGTKGQEC